MLFKPKMPKKGGIIDLQIYGGYGFDFLRSSTHELDRLSLLLQRDGVSGYCPTLLSLPESKLRSAVQKLAGWIETTPPEGAIPLGIHLEGPWLHPDFRGAHRARDIRAFHWEELEHLWELSGRKIKIITLAPELLSTSTRNRLGRWAKKNHVRLFIGHSKASYRESVQAFRSGFTGVTHAWNAQVFHHRETGPIGAASDCPGIYLSVIPDGRHISFPMVRLARKVFGRRLCFISDATPVAETKQKLSFAVLNGVQVRDGASRLPNDALAGGGFVLSQMFARWLKEEARFSGGTLSTQFQREAKALVSSTPREILYT